MLRAPDPRLGGRISVLSALILSAGLVVAALAAVGDLPMWSTIDGGGGISSGGGFTLISVIGQPDAGVLTGAGFTLHGGYIHGGGSTATAVVDPDSPPSGSVAAFRFHPVAPNPFNPVTSIAFDLPAPERVRLRIYNLRGELVKTLLEQEMPTGRHRLRWRGNDDGGRAVASGIYLLSFDAGSHQVRRKLTLVR